jgi:hypothetical protein
MKYARPVVYGGYGGAIIIVSLLSFAAGTGGEGKEDINDDRLFTRHNAGPSALFHINWSVLITNGNYPPLSPLVKGGMEKRKSPLPSGDEKGALFLGS